MACLSRKVSIYACAALVVVIVAIVLLSSSLKKVESTEVAVEYDTQERDLGAIKGEGLHSGPPFFDFLKFSAVYLSREIETRCVSKDGLLLPLTVGFQYLPNRTQVKEIVSLYRDSKNYDRLVVAAATSAIHHGCGLFAISEFQSRRIEVQEQQKKFMEQIFQGDDGRAGLMATVIDVQLKNIEPPRRWEAAVEAKENAREDINLARNERTQALTKAETRLKVAQEQARIAAAEAETESQILINRAAAEADSLLNRFEKEANQTKFAMEALGLDIEGILRYLLNRQIEKKKRIEIGMHQPAVTPNDQP
ncbi:hypothetical protein BSKO_11818 [Bryopsis sp. KO-2023]|nr:hypothetical protein BSKO_11818 [Bryopsis sp. KO-2023]